MLQVHTCAIYLGVIVPAISLKYFALAVTYILVWALKPVFSRLPWWWGLIKAKRLSVHDWWHSLLFTVAERVVSVNSAALVPILVASFKFLFYLYSTFYFTTPGLRVAWLVRVLPSDHKVPSSILGSVEIWTFVWPSFPPKLTRLSILPGRQHLLLANL